MFVVYWLDGNSGTLQPQFKSFPADDMRGAMTLMEELRSAQRNNGDKFGFVSLCSENPDSVGLAGAADPSKDYVWEKRRGNMPRAKTVLNPEDYKDF